MRRLLGSLFTAIAALMLLLLAGPVFAATPAELTKDLLQTEKEKPAGGKWTIQTIEPRGSYILSASGVIDSAFYPTAASNPAFQKQSANFARDKSELMSLLAGAVSSGKASLVRYREEYVVDRGYDNPKTDTRGVDVETAIWEFASEEKAIQFGLVLDRISNEAIAHANQFTANLRKQVDSSIADQAKRVGQPSGGATNARAAQISGTGNERRRTSLGLGDGGVTFETWQRYVHVQTVVSDGKVASVGKVGESTGTRWCFSYIRKGSRVLMAKAGGGFEVSSRRTVNVWADGKQTDEVFVFVPAPFPYPRAAVWNTIKSAYYKMAHESPANDPLFVTIKIRVPKTKFIKETNVTVFGPAFPDFKTAEIYGAVAWETFWYKGDVYDAPIYATVIHQGKVVKRVPATVAMDGTYDFSIRVNKKGTRDVANFRKDFSCHLVDIYSHPPARTGHASNVTIAAIANVPQGYTQNKLKKYLSHSPPAYLKAFEKAAFLIALKNDVTHQVTGGSGTPNLDKFNKNKKTPSGIVTNALMVLGEVYTSKDPAVSAAKNADDRLKKVRDYLKSKGVTIFKDTGNGQSKSGQHHWLDRVGLTDYCIDQVGK